MEITCVLKISAEYFAKAQNLDAENWRTSMKTLIALAATLVLAAPVLADNKTPDGKGLYPQWLISHDG